MNSRDADNARFEELMAHEFPEGLIPADRSRRLPDPPSAEPAAEPDAPPPPVEADDVPADNGFRSWAPPDEPDEPFVPPPRPPSRRWTAEGISGAAVSRRSAPAGLRVDAGWPGLRGRRGVAAASAAQTSTGGRRRSRSVAENRSSVSGPAATRPVEPVETSRLRFRRRRATEAATAADSARRDTTAAPGRLRWCRSQRCVPAPRPAPPSTRPG